MASLSFEVAQRARFIPGLLRHLLRVGDGRPSLHCGHYKLPSLLVIVLPKPAWGSFIRGNLRLSSGILNPVESAPPGSPPLDCWMKALPGKRLILKVSKMDDQRHWKSQGPNTCQTCFYQVLEDVIRDMYIRGTRCTFVSSLRNKQNGGRSFAPRIRGSGPSSKTRTECDTQDLGRAERDPRARLPAASCGGNTARHEI